MIFSYPSIKNTEELQTIINGGVKNVSYTQLVVWLCKEIKGLLALDEDVTSIEDPSSLLLELSSFLKEIGEIQYLQLKKKKNWKQ